MMRISVYFFLFFPLSFFAQNKDFPKDFFQKPLDIPLLLSGNFGELRDNHFHSGLDYKTQQKEGFNVYASAEGFVSRIKISQWGYGKAIYITHPNGYTTVYGHLKSFNPAIEKFIKTIQYQKENYEVEIFPKPEELIIQKGEIIALSGNTGGSSGPHLHFEIRETDNQIPMNPTLFGLNIEDKVKPIVNSLFAYPLSDEAQVNQLGMPVQINLKIDSLKNMNSDSVFASGKIGFAINTYDQQSGDTNLNGIYSLNLKVDGKKIFNYKFDKFSFDESKFINLLIDYEYYKTKFSRLQRCYIMPQNKLSIYDKTLLDKGVIDVQDGKSYKVEISILDFEGNETIVNIPLFGKKSTIALPKSKPISNYQIIPKESQLITLDGVIILFPRYTFYEETHLNITQNADGSVQIHEDIIPLTKNYTITFDLSKLDSESQKHSYVAKIGKKGSLTYVSSELRDKKLIGKASTLGRYIVKQDFKSPSIVPENFKSNQWMSELNLLQVKISDDLSGIKSHKSSIDGKWILMEWNHQTGILTYDFNDLELEGSKHELKIIVTDKADNTKTFVETFYRVKLN